MHEAERAGNIISRMRHFVEKREPQRRAVDLNAVVEEAGELTVLGQRIARQAAARLRTEPALSRGATPSRSSRSWSTCSATPSRR